MNNDKIKTWCRQTIQKMVSQNLSERSKVDVLKTAALTETLLGYFRGYRNDIYSMTLDFDQAVEGLELNRAQKKKVQDMLQSELKGLLRNCKEFEDILSAQLSLVNNLEEEKQEVLHQMDEQIHDEQELMKLIYDEVVRKGKRMVNVNRLLEKQKAA